MAVRRGSLGIPQLKELIELLRLYPEELAPKCINIKQSGGISDSEHAHNAGGRLTACISQFCCTRLAKMRLRLLPVYILLQVKGCIPFLAILT